MKNFLFLLLFPLSVFASQLEVCYKVYFWFLPVAKSCVTYLQKGKVVKIKSWAKTVFVGKLVKPVNSWGESHTVNVKPYLFALYQREGSYIRDHFYYFGEEGIEYRIVRYKGGKRFEKKGFFPTKESLHDPFSTSLYVYADTPNRAEKELRMFYDEKVQRVTYRTVGEERVKIGNRTYNCWKVLLKPHIKTKGILKPKGKWFIWVDKETNIPVQLKAVFSVGTVWVKVESVKGDKRLIKKVRDRLTAVKL